MSYSITEAFKQKGIGEALMRKSYRELQKLVGVVRIMPFQSVSDVMLRKLEARGIKVTGREQSDTRHYESTTADMISRINMVRRRRRRLSQERRIRLNRKLK
ncbi:hypothetical protein KKE06_03760 [Candidatus Micrarchaeota archaeon]|nr:hypothetical protein [Candidatus Micrarchaeota archaeon]